MTGKSAYKKDYASRVVDIALASKKTTNRIVGILLGVTEATVRNWRKEHPEFNRAFTHAHLMVSADVNAVLRGNLKTRKRKIITKGPKGEQTTIEEILPTHNDIAAYSKSGGTGTIYGADEEQAREAADKRKRDEQSRQILREVINRKIAGDITPLEAAQLLEAEGITAPASLMLEVERALGAKDDGKDKNPTLTPEQRKARIAELEEKHRGRIKPADNAG